MTRRRTRLPHLGGDGRRAYNHGVPLPPSTPPPTPAKSPLPHVDVAQFLRRDVSLLAVEMPATKGRGTPRINGPLNPYDFSDKGSENWAAYMIDESKWAAREILHLARYIQRRGASNLDQIIADVTERLNRIIVSRSNIENQSLADLRSVAQSLYTEREEKRGQLDPYTERMLEETINRVEASIYRTECQKHALDNVIAAYRRALTILSGPIKSPRQRLDERSALAIVGAILAGSPLLVLHETGWALVGAAAGALLSSIFYSFFEGVKEIG